MPEQKDIRFDTVYKLVKDLTNNITVKLEAESKNPDTISANLNSTVKVNYLNNIKQFTGQLVMITKDNGSDIDWEINSKGELIVHGDNAKNYHINLDGDLIYEYR